MDFLPIALKLPGNFIESIPNPTEEQYSWQRPFFNYANTIPPFLSS